MTCRPTTSTSRTPARCWSVRGPSRDGSAGSPRICSTSAGSTPTVSLRSEPIELGELGRAVLAEFELASASRGVNVVLEDDGIRVWALADPGSVARILRILLDNALRVAPRGSEVKVVVRPSPRADAERLDQGPGVAPEERALIFERFKRGRETGGEAGFGLGLAIGRELAQRMGGSLVLADTDVTRARPSC